MSDLRPADWLLYDPAPSTLRANVGPSGFESYARVLHSPDGDGDRMEGHLASAPLRALVDILARHTATSAECFFALWEGYGDIHGGEAASFLTAFSGSPSWPTRMFTKEKPKAPPPPAFPPQVMDGPLLQLHGEQYFLFAGAVGDAGEWGASSWGNGVPRGINSPNLMWPQDHAWFVTTNLESTWTGVGGSARLVDDLLQDDRLEVVRQRYDEGSLR